MHMKKQNTFIPHYHPRVPGTLNKQTTIVHKVFITTQVTDRTIGSQLESIDHNRVREKWKMRKIQYL